MLFGSCTICLNIFRVGYDVSHIHCKSQLELIFPVIEMIFIGVQVTFRSRPRTACTQAQPAPRNRHTGKYIHGPGGGGTHIPQPSITVCLHVPTTTHTYVYLHTQRVTEMQTPTNTPAHAYLHIMNLHPPYPHPGTQSYS